MSRCSFIPFSRKIAVTSRWLLLQLADRAIHQEFGPFALCWSGRLQFMRHMSQKSVLFRCAQIQQTASEPFQLRRQALEVGRSADGDGPGKRAAPELADGARRSREWAGRTGR